MREESNQQGQLFQGKAGEDRYPEDEEIDLFDYLEVIIKRRWLIIFGVAICVLTTLIYTSMTELTYKAEATILPAEGREYLLDFTGKAQGRRSLSFYLDILKSIPISSAVLEKKYEYQDAGEDKKKDLTEYFGAKTMGRAISALHGCADFSLKSGVITISVVTRSAELSASVANEYIRQLELYNSERRTSQAKEQLKFIEGRLREVKQELEKAEEDLTGFKKTNRNLLSTGKEGPVSSSSPVLAMELARLVREVDVKSDLSATLTKQYEMARIEVKKEIPIFEVINYAVPPEHAVGRKRKMSVLLSFVAGGFVAVFLAFFLEYLEKMRLAGRMNFVLAELKRDRKRILRLLGKHRA